MKQGRGREKRKERVRAGEMQAENERGKREQEMKGVNDGGK